MSPYTPSGYGFTPTPIGAGGGNGGGGLGGPGSGGGGGGGGNNGSAMGGGYDISGATDYAVDSTSGQFDPQRPIEPLPDSIGPSTREVDSRHPAPGCPKTPTDLER